MLLRFGLSLPFSLALLGESLLISLPTGTKIFQFPAFALLTEWPDGQVSLFRNPRIKAC